MGQKAYQTSIEDFIVPPAPENPATDLVFSVIRDKMPGVRALLLEDYWLCDENLNLFYTQVRMRLRELDYAGPNGERVYIRPGCLVVARPGHEEQSLPWYIVMKDIQDRIRGNRWIGSMEEKAENAAARKLKEAAGKSPWNLGGKNGEKD